MKRTNNNVKKRPIINVITRITGNIPGRANNIPNNVRRNVAPATVTPTNVPPKDPNKVSSNKKYWFIGGITLFLIVAIGLFIYFGGPAAGKAIAFEAVQDISSGQIGFDYKTAQYDLADTIVPLTVRANFAEPVSLVKFKIIYDSTRVSITPAAAVGENWLPADWSSGTGFWKTNPDGSLDDDSTTVLQPNEKVFSYKRAFFISGTKVSGAHDIVTLNFNVDDPSVLTDIKFYIDSASLVVASDVNNPTTITFVEEPIKFANEQPCTNPGDCQSGHCAARPFEYQNMCCPVGKCQHPDDDFCVDSGAKYYESEYLEGVGDKLCQNGAWVAADFGQEICDNGIDDNGDGYLDCEESTCQNVDVCLDNDYDGFNNPVDNCPDKSNNNQADMDGDGVGNVCDNCISVANPGQENADGDTQGNACECTTDLATDEPTGYGSYEITVKGESTGVVYSTGNVDTQPDDCIDNTAVREYYCSGGYLASIDLDCPAETTCSGGACVTEEPETCLSNADCSGELVCKLGTCVEGTLTPDSTKLANKKQCTDNDDCQSGNCAGTLTSLADNSFKMCCPLNYCNLRGEDNDCVAAGEEDAFFEEFEMVEKYANVDCINGKWGIVTVPAADTEVCHDQIDNDGDGYTSCYDTDCINHVNCPVQFGYACNVGAKSSDDFGNKYYCEENLNGHPVWRKDVNSVCSEIECRSNTICENGKCKGITPFTCAPIADECASNYQCDSETNKCEKIIATEADPDADGIENPADNCPNVYNPDQADNEGDGAGDACDGDDDNDGVGDGIDTCPKVFGTMDNGCIAKSCFTAGTGNIGSLSGSSVCAERVFKVATSQGKDVTILTGTAEKSCVGVYKGVPIYTNSVGTYFGLVKYDEHPTLGYLIPKGILMTSLPSCSSAATLDEVKECIDASKEDADVSTFYVDTICMDDTTFPHTFVFSQTDEDDSFVYGLKEYQLIVPWYGNGITSLELFTDEGETDVGDVSNYNVGDVYELDVDKDGQTDLYFKYNSFANGVITIIANTEAFAVYTQENCKNGIDDDGDGKIDCADLKDCHNYPHCAKSAEPVCGNGIIEYGELCDGAELGGATCQSLGKGAGVLSCSPASFGPTQACRYDVTGCGVPKCPACDLTGDCQFNAADLGLISTKQTNVWNLVSNDITKLNEFITCMINNWS